MIMYAYIYTCFIPIHHVNKIFDKRSIKKKKNKETT